MTSDPKKGILSVEDSESSFDLAQIIQVLREKVWLIAIFTGAGLVGGAIYAKHMPRTFLAQAVVQIDPDQKKVVSFQDTQQKDLANDEVADTVIATCKSRAFLQEVLESQNFLADPEFVLTTGAHTTEAGINALAGMERVQVRHGTQFLDVGAESGNPRVAQNVANGLAEGFIRDEMKQREESSDMAVQFLVNEAERRKELLQRSDEARQKYMEDHNAMSLQEQQDTVVSALRSQMTDYMNTKAKRMRLEVDDEEIKKLAGQPEALLQVASVAEHPIIQGIKQKINALEAQIATLSLRYTEKHPKMIQARAELAEAKAALLENALKVPPLIHSSYEAAVAAEKKFDAARDEQEKMAIDLNRKQIPFNALTRDVETNRALYDAILTRLKEAQIASGIETGNIRIFEKALLPGEPTQTKKSRILAIGLGAGAAVGIALSLLLNMMDSSLRTVDQTEKVSGLQVLSAIPRGPRRAWAHYGHSVLLETRGPVAESFRTLRTSLYFAGRQAGRQTVLFTSAVPGEGKTFCSIHYAVSLAQQRLRTLLIDADLRAPMIERALPASGAPAAQNGVGEWLAGKAGAPLSVYPSGIENLSILPAGKGCANPSELLSGPMFGELMKKARAEFDRIIIDTAPVIPVSDTLMIVEHADLTCLVTHAGKTPRKWVLRARDLLAKAGVKPAGIVFNALPNENAGYNMYVKEYSGAISDITRKPALEMLNGG